MDFVKLSLQVKMKPKNEPWKRKRMKQDGTCVFSLFHSSILQGGSTTLCYFWRLPAPSPWYKSTLKRIIEFYPSSHNHGSGKWPPWRLKSSSRPPFSTSNARKANLQNPSCQMCQSPPATFQFAARRTRSQIPKYQCPRYDCGPGSGSRWHSLKEQKNTAKNQRFSGYPPENERMSPEKGPFLKEFSSSNPQFSGARLVFRGWQIDVWFDRCLVLFGVVCLPIYKRCPPFFTGRYWNH